MKNFNEIMVLNQDELTTEQREFRETHQTILNAGNLAADCATAFAKNLKHMHDTKLYEAAGFETFEDYTETTMSIKKSQAYKYLSLAENETFHSSGKIGITKLSLIAAAPEEHQAELVETVKTENLTVKELKAQIARLQKENECASDLMKDLDKARDEAVNEAEENMRTANEKAKELAKLEQEIKALKNNLKNQPKPEIKTVEKTVEDKESKEALKKAQQELKAKEELLKTNTAELAKLQKQIELAGDQNFIEFKIKFEEFKKLGNDIEELLNKLSPDLKVKMQKAVESLIRGWLNG